MIKHDANCTLAARPSNSVMVETCTVPMTASNSLVSDIHNRMLVIIRAEDYDLWLDLGIADPRRAYDARQMRRTKPKSFLHCSALINGANQFWTS